MDLPYQSLARASWIGSDRPPRWPPGYRLDATHAAPRPGATARQRTRRCTASNARARETHCRTPTLQSAATQLHDRPTARRHGARFISGGKRRADRLRVDFDRPRALHRPCPSEATCSRVPTPARRAALFQTRFLVSIHANFLNRNGNAPEAVSCCLFLPSDPNRQRRLSEERAAQLSALLDSHPNDRRARRRRGFAELIAQARNARHALGCTTTSAGLVQRM